MCLFQDMLLARFLVALIWVCKNDLWCSPAASFGK
jgi:hypothetical protein